MLNKQDKEKKGIVIWEKYLKNRKSKRKNKKKENNMIQKKRK